MFIPGGNFVYAVKKTNYSDSCIFRKKSFTVVIWSGINSNIYHKTIEILENFYIKLVKWLWMPHIPFASFFSYETCCEISHSFSLMQKGGLFLQDVCLKFRERAIILSIYTNRTFIAFYMNAKRLRLRFTVFISLWLYVD